MVTKLKETLRNIKFATLCRAQRRHKFVAPKDFYYYDHNTIPFTVISHLLQHICGTQLCWPSTPQFGQPSRVAPAGRAPRAQWTKKRSKGERGVEICLSVWNAPKGKKLGVRIEGIIKQGKIRFWYILIPIVQKGKKFVTFALVSTYGTTMVLHKEGVYRDGR